MFFRSESKVTFHGRSCCFGSYREMGKVALLPFCDTVMTPVIKVMPFHSRGCSIVRCC